MQVAVVRSTLWKGFR